MRKWMLALLLILLLSACGSQPEAAPSPTETRTVAPEPTEIATVTVPPTETEEPTFTPTPSPSVTPNSSPFSQPEGRYDPNYSPDGAWVAWSGWGEDPWSEVIVENWDGLVSWVVGPDIILEYDKTCLLCYDLVYNFVHWSADERYGYISATIPLDGPVFFGPYAAYILRLDLETGEIIDLISGVEGMHAFDISSSDLLAYTSWNKGTIFNIVDLADGSFNQVRLDQFDRMEIGDLIWLPDETGFLFSINYDSPQATSDLYPFSIWYLDLNSSSANDIYFSEGCLGINPAWVSESEIMYTCDKLDAEFQYLVFDFETWEFSEISE